MIDGHTSRTHFYVSMQQSGLVCAVNALPNETLEVQGQRVRAQPDSFWSYYPGDVGILCKVCVCAHNRCYDTFVTKQRLECCSSSFSSESDQLESTTITHNTRKQRLHDCCKFHRTFFLNGKTGERERKDLTDYHVKIYLPVKTNKRTVF